MLIKRKRINNIDKYISHFKNGDNIVMMVPWESHKDKIKTIWIEDNQSILPSDLFGKACEYNSEGKIIKRKDLPMEKYILELPYEIKDYWWYMHYWVNYLERERYPRELIQPFSVYIQRVQENWEIFIVSELIENDQWNKDKIKNTINIFLELFWECYITTDQYDLSHVVQLNWEIIPIGKYPWEKIKGDLIFPNKRVLKSKLFQSRLDYLSTFKPDFLAKWVYWFNWYVIFWYKDKNYFVAENIKYGNATYIFNQDRATISRMTKAEIIQWNLSEERTIHSASREREIKKILS